MTIGNINTIKKSIAPIMGLMISVSILAQPSNGLVSFNIANEFEKIKAIEAKFSETNQTIQNLILYSDQLELSEEKAERCIKKSEAELKTLDELLKSIQIESLLRTHQVDYQYLQEKKLFYTKQLSECRLLLYRSKEILFSHKDKLQKLTANKLLKQNTPLWDLDSHALLKGWSDIHLANLYTRSGIELLSYRQILMGLLFVLFSLLMARYIRTLCRHYLKSLKENVCSFTPLVINSFSQWVYPLFFWGSLSIFFSIVYSSVKPTPLLMPLSYLFLLMSTMIMFSHYLLYSPQQMAAPSFFSNVGKTLYRNTTLLIIGLGLGWWVSILFKQNLLPTSWVDLLHTLFITLLMFIVTKLLYTFFQINEVKNKEPLLLNRMIKILLATLFLTIISLEWAGFNELSLFLIQGTFFTTLLSFLALGLLYWVNTFHRMIGDKGLNETFQRLLGVKRYHILGELVLIIFSIYSIVVCFYSLALIKIWGGSQNRLDNMVEALLKGFNLAGLKIIPYRIIIAFLAFAAIILLGRLIATAIARKWNRFDEKDTQVAIASIMTYVTFLVALLLALLIIGVDFTGLAIIAGALSVGIGLGLQSITNNFISGLILLIEKPIKPGDRITINDKEGFVKKIRIRSTQITTLYKEDVIVPNADLINNAVTNYMFNDNYWRVACSVGVAYGSNIELVKKLLFEVATQHPDVVQEEPNEPIVLFRGFGDSSLLFELWCVIYDVNQKFFVVSDMNFAIDKLFRKNKVVIAFPQRDIHIKSDSGQ